MPNKLSKRELENKFEKLMIDNYNYFRSTVQKGDRSGVRWRGQLTMHGGVKTAKRFLRSAGNRSAVAEMSWPLMNRRLSVEYAVTRPIFKSLFTPEEIAEARRRLKLMQV